MNYDIKLEEREALVHWTGAAPDGAPVARREPQPWVRYASVRSGSTPIGDSASPQTTLELAALYTLGLTSATSMAKNS